MNSALQRARQRWPSAGAAEPGPVRPLNDTQIALLAQYVDAFSRHDMDALTMLMHVDVTLTLAPFTVWFLGPGSGCRGSRLIPTAANGRPRWDSTAKW